jgi:uncharacterized glyoxalase superfamily protein PhnB
VFTEFLTNLYTDDLPAMLRFYRDAVGAAETFRYPATGDPSHVELRLGGTTLALSTYAAVAGYGLPPATRGEPFELAVRVTDVDAAFAALAAAGAAVLRAPWPAPNGQRVAYLTDPDGTRLHLWA